MRRLGLLHHAWFAADCSLFYRTAPGINQPLLSVGMSENTHKTMPCSQDKEITFKFAADATAEHPYASTGYGRGAFSVRVRTSKARTAFPVGPLVRVDGGCMELDGPTLITGRRLSVLVIRAATAPRRSPRSPPCVTVQNLRATHLENGLEL